MHGYVFIYISSLLSWWPLEHSVKMAANIFRAIVGNRNLSCMQEPTEKLLKLDDTAKKLDYSILIKRIGCSLSRGKGCTWCGMDSIPKLWHLVTLVVHTLVSCSPLHGPFPIRWHQHVVCISLVPRRSKNRRGPGTHCLRMREVSLVTCILSVTLTMH